jgi:ABC-type cobalt transport system substrate-binding protein
MKLYIFLILLTLFIIALIWVPEIEITGASDWFLEFQKKLTEIKDQFEHMFRTVFELTEQGEDG